MVLVNSNPATIMTDPELADRTYVEPLTVEYAEEIIRKERPDALLSTVGGQTGLNLAVELAEAGVLEKYGVELIGAKIDAIKKAEDRLLFKDAMRKIGLETPQSQLVNNVEDGLEFAERIGYPVILRPSFTLGGTGGGIAYNREELIEILERGLDLSPVHEVLIEESVLGWKEFELEVMRDLADNVIIVCSIENFDPMGVHTGDSITVAPAQTLTDREYQMMRDGALRCLREIGVDTGGSNVQFAINPEDGRMVIIEMNPRVSRSSALASKATGFPHRQDRRQAGRGLPARRDPERHHPQDAGLLRADHRLRGGEDPALAVREVPRRGPDAGHADEVGRRGDGHRPHVQAGAGQGHAQPRDRQGRRRGSLRRRPDPAAADHADAGPPGLHPLRASQRGYTVEQMHEMTAIDPWFLRADAGDGRIWSRNWSALSLGDGHARADAARPSATASPTTRWREPGRTSRWTCAAGARSWASRAVFNRVDTCAAEFESFTPYLYSSYESECEAEPARRARRS